MTDTVRYLGLRVHAMAVKRVMFSILMDIASKRINQRIKIVNSSFMGNAENALIVTISMRTGIASDPVFHGTAANRTGLRSST